MYLIAIIALGALVVYMARKGRTENKKLLQEKIRLLQENSRLREEIRYELRKQQGLEGDDEEEAHLFTAR